MTDNPIYNDIKKLASPLMIHILEEMTTNDDFEITFSEYPSIITSKKFISLECLYKPTSSYKKFILEDGLSSKNLDAIEYDVYAFYISNIPPIPGVSDTIGISNKFISGKYFFNPLTSEEHITLNSPSKDVRIPLDKVAIFYDNMIKEIKARGEFNIDFGKLVDVLIQLRIIRPKDGGDDM